MLDRCYIQSAREEQMKAKLKVCPFCGEDAEVRFSGKIYTDDTASGYFVVGCTVCPATVRGMFYQGESPYNFPYDLDEMKGAKRAIKIWNTRRGADGEHA
jgi:hypothetical protein